LELPDKAWGDFQGATEGRGTASARAGEDREAEREKDEGSVMAKNPFGGAGEQSTKSAAELECEIKQVELETAQIRLEQMREENEAYRARKAARIRANEANLAQLRTDHLNKLNEIRICTHRQGGSPGRERKGSGPSALRVVILPDNRELVMCANCPMRVFSPLPANKSPRQRRNESPEQRDARVAAYNAAVAEFEQLKEQSQNQLTPEAGQPMHCGKTFQFEDGNGNQVSMPAPCDGYAQGLDNRRVA
jgi:hypothetical protein